MIAMSDPLAAFVAGAAAGLLEDPLLLVGQAAGPFAGDLGEDLVEPGVELLLGDDRRRGRPRRGRAGRLGRPGGAGRGPGGRRLALRLGVDDPEPGPSARQERLEPAEPEVERPEGDRVAEPAEVPGECRRAAAEAEHAPDVAHDI